MSSLNDFNFDMTSIGRQSIMILHYR